MITINDIKLYEKNAKPHPKGQLEKLAKSIQTFGWRSHILVDQDGVIITGHGRFLAYQEYKNRMELPEAYIVDDKGNTISGKLADWALSVDQEKLFRIWDNEIAAMSQVDQGMKAEELATIKSVELQELAMQDFAPIEEIKPESFENKNKEIDQSDMQRPSVINFAYNYTEYLNVLDLIQNATEKLGCDTKEEMLKMLLQDYE